MKKLSLVLFLIIFPMLSFSQEVTTPGINNLTYELIPQYELPKRYLLDNITTSYPQESFFRRADIVFFLSIPATYFIMQTVINLFNTANVILNNFNGSLIRDNLGFTNGEWNFIIASLVLIPFGTALYDYIYVKEYPLIPPFEQPEIREVHFNFSIYRVNF